MPQKSSSFFDQFEEDQPDDFFSQFEHVDTVGPAQNPSFLSKAWQTVNQPLVPSSAFQSKTPLPSQKGEAHGFYETYAEPFMRGVVEEGLPNLASSFTSPLNIGLAGIGAGEYGAMKAGFPQVARIGGLVNKGVGAAVAGHGAYTGYEGYQENDPMKFFTGLTEAAAGGLGMAAHLPSVSKGVSEHAPIESLDLNQDITPLHPEQPIGGNVTTIKVKKPTSELIRQLREQGFESAGIDRESGYPLMKRTEPITDPRITSEVVMPEQKITGMVDEFGNELGGHAGPEMQATGIGMESGVIDPLEASRKIEEARSMARGQVDRELGNVPPLEGLPDDISRARTSTGGIQIGADVKSLGKVLGSSLYKGNITTVATKELLQNSIDAIRHLGPEGKIGVKFNRMPKEGLPYIEVNDNGKGLTRQEIETIFTDLGASGKRADESAIGGFGLAKAAPLLGGEEVHVNTVARDPSTGKLMSVEFNGTPDQLLEGVELNHTEVPEGTPTGTKVRVMVPKDSTFWDAKDMVNNISKYSNFEGNIHFGEGHGFGEPELAPLEKENLSGGKEVTKIETPSANTKLIIPKGVKVGENQAIELVLSNKGMFQGRKVMYLDSPTDVPNRLIVDIDSKVPEGHPDYPFTANREALRGSVDEAVEGYIRDNIIKPALDKKRQGLTELYEGMPAIQTKQGRTIYFHDTGGKFTPEEMQEIMNHPVVQELGNDLGNIVDEAVLLMEDDPQWVSKLDKVGIIFDDKLRGVNIPSPGKQKFAVMVNPFSMMKNQGPSEAAAGFVHTTLHELAHLGVRGHTESFTVKLGDVYEKFGALRAIEAQRKFLDTVSPDGRTYTPEVQEVLQRYIESRGRSVTKNDVLTGTGVSSRIKGTGEGEIPASNKPNRTRTTRVAVSNNANPKTIERLQNEGYRPTGQLTTDNKPIWEKVDEPIVKEKEKPSKTREIYNLARGTTTSFDISAPMRQGLPLIGTKAWFKSWGPMMKSYGSEGAFRKVMSEIEQKPLFKPSVEQVYRNGEWISKEKPSFAEESGLKLTDLNGLSNREEVLMSTLAERIPLGIGKGIRASNRAYTAFLNKLRADTFESLINDATEMGLNPKQNMVLAKEIADFVNTATGSGKLAFRAGSKELNLEQHSKLLTDLLFSPRLMASRMNMLNPSTYLMANPMVRKQYMKAMLRTAAAWTTVASLGKIMGAQVSLDPTNADFGKIRFGNTRLDPAAGFQQYLVAAARLISGKTTSSTSGREYTLGEGYKAPTRKSVVEDFASNKLHPVLKFAYDLLDASKYKPFHVGDRIAQMYIPLVIQDIMELAKEDPKLLPLAGLSAIGMGTQTYEKGGTDSAVIPPEMDLTLTGGGL